MDILHSFWFWASAVVFAVVWIAAGLSASRRRGVWFLLLAAVVTAAVMFIWVPRALNYHDQVVLASIPTPEPEVVERIVEKQVPYTVTVTSPITVTVPYTVEVQVPAASAVLTDTAWVKALVTAPASVVWALCSSEGGLCASWNTFANGDGQPVKMKVLACPLKGARLVEGKEVEGLPVGEWQVLGITVRPCPVVVPTSAPVAKATVAPKFDPLSVVTLKEGVKLSWSNCVPAEPDAVCWNTYKNGPGAAVWMKLSCYQDGVRFVDGREVTGLPAGENPSVLGITARPCK